MMMLMMMGLPEKVALFHYYNNVRVSKEVYTL